MRKFQNNDLMSFALGLLYVVNFFQENFPLIEIKFDPVNTNGPLLKKSSY